MNPLNPLYVAVAWVMTHIHSALSLVMPSTSGQAWFLTIVVLVVLMRLLLVPLFVKQMHSMRKMSALNPQLMELRKKYKGDKQTLNEETMRLYRENGVNPLGGCLPLLAQMPMFFALFSVLRGIADWKPGTPTPYGMSESMVKSAQNANILGAHISDKVLFTGTMHVPLEAKIVILCAVDDQRDHDVPDGPAEHQARHDAGDDAGQPDGGLAEVHGLHRAVLRSVRPVLGVRPGPVLGDHERVDPRPAVRTVQAVSDGARCRVGDRRHGACGARRTGQANGRRQQAHRSQVGDFGKPSTAGKPSAAKPNAAAKPSTVGKPSTAASLRREAGCRQAGHAHPRSRRRSKNTPKPPAGQQSRKKPQGSGSAGRRGGPGMGSRRRRTARPATQAACCGAWDGASQNPSHRRRHPRLSSSGSSASVSRAANVPVRVRHGQGQATVRPWMAGFGWAGP